jgi:methionyl aminopeptidase
MIKLKTKEEIGLMREGGQMLAMILKKLAEASRPGVTTYDLEKLARELLLSYKVKPAFLNYGGFPATLCVSLNDEVVHGVPSKNRTLETGDIVSLDMGLIYKGFNLDSAVTVPVLGEMSYEEWGKQNPKHKVLLETTQESLNAGINQARPGNKLGKVSSTIQKIIEKKGFGVVRDLVGHGIGKELHEEPQVPNFGSENDGVRLEEGMVIAIEPMVTEGDWRLKTGDNDFVFKTKDGSFAAHFEHTVAITAEGPLVLTK